MPKVTMTFKLPEERSEYNLATKAVDMSCVLSEFANILRNKTKYATQDDPETPGWEAARTAFWQCCQDEGIDPYEF